MMKGKRYHDYFFSFSSAPTFRSGSYGVHTESVGVSVGMFGREDGEECSLSKRSQMDLSPDLWLVSNMTVCM